MNKIHPTRILALSFALCSASALSAAQAILLDDATVQLSMPANNFGALPQLQTGPGSIALVRFSLASLPSDATEATLVKATLRLYVNRLVKPGSIQLSSITDAWSERTVTYSTMPRLLTPSSGPISVDASGAFISLDVTPQLRAAWRNGFAFFSGGIESLGAELFFDSKENTAASRPPALEIELTGPQGLPGLTGLTGPQGPKGDRGDPPVPTLVGRLSTFQILDTSVVAGLENNYHLSCPAEYPVLVSGGCGFPFLYGTLHALADMRIYYSGPDPARSNTAWRCSVYNGSFATQTLRAYVNCAK